MAEQGTLPFKVGQSAESRSFKSGFRGAWFRCKIKEIGLNRGQVVYALEFYDFPDEKISWTRVYQIPPRPGGGKSKEKRQLILRPQYPPIYLERELPDTHTISEVTVVRNDVWKVGDNVDWLSDGCYWSGKVTQILGNEKVKVMLPPPPFGEGSSYDVPCKDLRPSLDWSLEHGWSVPISKEGKNSCRCARLIQPVNQGLPILDFDAVEERTKDFQSNAESSFDSSCSSDTSSESSPHVDIPKGARCGPEANMEPNTGFNGIAKTSCSDSVSSSHVRDVSAQPDGDGQDYRSGSLKKMRTGASLPLNSTRSETLEAAIMDLEELVNKVKWLKGILDCGTPLSNAGRPPWKFVEHRISSTPK